MTDLKQTSLKRKSLLSIAGLVIILSGLSLITFGILQNYVSRLSEMIDITVVTNRLKTICGTPTDGLPFLIESYSLHPDNDRKKVILESFNQAEKLLAQLDSQLTSDEAQIQFQLLKNMFLSSNETYTALLEKIDKKASFSEVNRLTTMIKENSILINAAAQVLISVELAEQQVAKAELESRARLSGILLLISIALTSIFGLIFFYRYFIVKSIITPILDIQNTMVAFATDDGDFKLRAKVESKDEIGTLADFFNKMADTIQSYKENLEGLVDTRTRELQSVRSKLIQSDKLAALGEMAGGVAHEINTPLAIIAMKSKQALRMIDSESLDRQTARSLVTDIQSTTERIAKIVKGLRSFSRDASNDPFQNTHARILVEDALSLCKEKFTMAGIELRVSEIQKDVALECRAAELTQVLVNFLANSYDAIQIQEKKWVELQIFDKADAVEFWITDSGNGIPKAVQEKLFHPFFTTKEVGKGTGLGLSISRGIVESHHGNIKIDNECPNTRFIIFLPKRQIG